MGLRDHLSQRLQESRSVCWLSYGLQADAQNLREEPTEPVGYVHVVQATLFHQELGIEAFDAASEGPVD